MAKRKAKRKEKEDPFVQELMNSLVEEPYDILALIVEMTRDIGSEIAAPVAPEHRIIWAQIAMKVEEAADIAKRLYPEGTVFDPPHRA